MVVKRIGETSIDGTPALILQIDGKRATLTADQKVNMLADYGAVCLGDDFEDEYTVTLAADPAIGMPESTLYGYTQDEKIVKLYREFLQET